MAMRAPTRLTGSANGGTSPAICGGGSPGIRHLDRRTANRNARNNAVIQKDMEHITLNTGHSVPSQKSEVADEIIALVQRELLPRAEFAIPGVGAGWCVKLSRRDTASVFSIYYFGTPVVTCGLAIDAQASDLVWPELKHLHSLARGCLTKIPSDWRIESRQPRSVPWLGVVLLPTVTIVPPEDMDWLGDFERCLAWAIIDEILAEGRPCLR